METILFILIFISALLLLVYGAMTECDSCHRWWALELESSTLLERWQEAKTVEGDGETGRPKCEKPPAPPNAVTVQITLEKRENKYHCRKCGARKSEIETSEV